MQSTQVMSEKKEGLKTISELHSILMDMDNCVVLDIETTGFSPEKHAEIIQIGAARLDLQRRRYVGYRNYLIRPSEAFSIPPKITDLTGIKWEDLRDNPYIEDILPEFARFIGDSPIVAHNAVFDWPRFLVPAFQKVGLHATNECICSMRLAKNVFPGRGQKGYNLETLCGMYGYELVNHHNALADVKATGGLFVRLLQEYRSQHEADAVDMFHTQLPALNPKPSEIPCVDFNDLVIRRISAYKGASKKHGPNIYVNTNFGKLCYSTRRHLWSCTELWTEYNAPVQTWGDYVLYKIGLDADSFVQRYTSAA